MRIFILLLALSGCMTAPKDLPSAIDNKTIRQQLDEPRLAVNVGPKDKEETRSTIRGKVLSGASRMPFPVNGAIVNLVREGQVLSSHRTSINGEFEFTGDFAEGDYELVWVHAKRIFKTKITLQGQLAEGIEIRDLD